jgi:preprotein translocase subunit Sss1
MRNRDRWIIYLIIFLSVFIPLVGGLRLPPAPLTAATESFSIIEKLEHRPGKIAFVAMDYGPSNYAENGPQAEVALEHLMRRRIPIVLMTQISQGEGFLESVPRTVVERLEKEYPNQKWTYGVDWITIGFRTGPALFIQALAKSEDISRFIKKDARGNDLASLPMMKEVKTIKDVDLLVQLTGYLGTFDTYVQFFQRNGYAPTFIHGCTSITIPEAYIYRDSGQLKGILEGVSGAAWYSELLQRSYPERKEDSSRAVNTALGISQLAIVGMIAVGNLPILMRFLLRIQK